jgi:hypothetical protein
MFSGGADHFKINSSGVLEFGGANAPGWTNNLGLTYASSTLTITDAQGAALSTTNPGWVTVPSTTAGTVVPMEVTAATHLFIDDGGASDIVGEEFGVTTGVAWGDPRPFFLYACMEDANAGVKFAISPNPCASVVPATANIGYHANPAATPSDSNFFFLTDTDPTTAFDTNPCVKIGAINMVMSAADDWTVQALATVPSGIGQHFIDAHHTNTWTFPSGQNGATNGYLYSAGSKAPTWTVSANEDYFYTLSSDGYVNWKYDTGQGGNCVQNGGPGGDSLFSTLPYTPNLTFYVNQEYRHIGLATVNGTNDYHMMTTYNGNYPRIPIYLSTTTTIKENTLGDNPIDDLYLNGEYKAF